MDSFNYVIVGSGPAGIAAARRLSRKGVCIIDVGHTEPESFPFNSLREALAANQPEKILGENWQLLSNLVKPLSIHPKLRAQAIRYVMSGEKFSVHGHEKNTVLNGSGSHARGGMSNAWGGQLIRYTNSDLDDAGGWPITIEMLAPYYDDLEEHIGIAGQVDDMDTFFGHSKLMLGPTKLVPSANHLLSKYQIRAGRLKQSNLLLGRPRLALRTSSRINDELYKYGETEFLTTGQSGLYTAQRTLDELICNNEVDYLSGYKLTDFDECTDHVGLRLRNIETGQRKTIRARHLLIGCGTIQTAHLILRKYSSERQRLPFIDHPPTLLPLFIPKMFGQHLPGGSVPTQLAGTLMNQGRRNIISFHYPGSLLKSDLLPDIPLPIDSALRVLRSLLSGMLVAQMWEASHPSPNNQIFLNTNDEITINYPDRSKYLGTTELLRELRPLGAFSTKYLVSQSPPGWGFHHAGCLPMRRKPNKFETQINGKLWDSQRVRIIDGSTLPSLPAKHHSLTLMANSARIADEVLKCGY